MTRLGADGELESARVARILRDDIVQGRRLPGDKLIERDIAAELDVSRLPVREAIRALVAEGIVLVKPRSWAVVREFTLRDLRDLRGLCDLYGLPEWPGWMPGWIRWLRFATAG